ncbi:MAG: GNAT family N-acetyltransferase [Verrucomicrobiota bacterium]
MRLRPIRLLDAPFIVQLRNSQHALGKIGDSTADVAAQEEWIQRYFKRAGDYYFIIEKARTDEPLGTVGIYDIAGTQGECGRWIVLPASPAAPASSWLAWHVCFDVLKLEVVLARVVETNLSVVSFQKKIGNPCVGRVEGEQQIGGKPVAMVHFCAKPAQWPAISEKLSHYACLAEKYL